MPTVSPPCYFNTGCCSFPDGDITGLEIADGMIRLVRWPAKLHEIVADGSGVDTHRRILEEAALEEILATVTDHLSRRRASSSTRSPRPSEYWGLSERNVLGGPLESCGTDPLTGFYRDGCCSTGPDDAAATRSARS